MRTTLGASIVLFALALAGATEAGGPWRAQEGNTRGWQFMTIEERLAHQARIRAFKSYEACDAYRVEHHRVMEERARSEGAVLAPARRDFCEHLKPVARTR